MLIPEFYHLILSNKRLDKICEIQNARDFTFNDNDNSANEGSCTVYKSLNGNECKHWDDICDFAVVYIREKNEYYEIKCSENDSGNVLKKTLTLTSLCEAELSGIKLYDIEINTKDDIARDDYTIPSVLYKNNDEKNSILHRIFQKAPHYTIVHVDKSIANIQRSFSFDDKSIYDALSDIAQEIKCIFKFNSVRREVSVYDLLTYCEDCGYREEYENECPKCGSKNIIRPYGEDTCIFIDTYRLANEITIEKDSDNVFNTLKLKAGDELFTSTVKSLNPNGTDYLYYFNEETMKSMPSSLSKKIKEYNTLLDDYNDNYAIGFEDVSIKNNYNSLVNKYNAKKYSQYKYNDDDEKVLTQNTFSLINEELKGFQQLISLYYDVVDFNLYLESSLMPVIKKEVKTAKEEIENLTEDNLSPMALSKLTSNTSSATVESSLKLFIKVYLYNNYKITLNTKSWDYIGDDNVANGTHYGYWEGTINLQSYKDETDTKTSELLRIKVTDDYSDFLDQKLRKKLVSSNEDIGGVYDVISIKYTDDDKGFKDAIKFYSYNRLTSFYDAYKGALDVLIEADQASPSADFYNEIYLPYYNRSVSLENELALRKQELDIINALSDFIQGTKTNIQNALNLKNYLGDDWNTFCSYRRESTYENQNYISTNYDNATLIKQANKFIDIAKVEVVKAGTPQITVTVSLKNIYLIEEFQPLIHNFKVGNWIRAKCDGILYKLRLNSIQVDDSDFTKCGVEFTSIRQKNNCLSEIENTLKSAKSIVGSYSYTQTQMEDASQKADNVSDWFTKGLNSNAKLMNDADNQNVVYDRNGLLVRSYDEVTDTYEPTQLKAINSTIAITDDNWRTVKTAIGKFQYLDPETGVARIAYGVNAETIIGQLLLGQNLKIYSETGYNKLTFDDNGFNILAKPVNGKYSTNIFNISKQETDGSIKKLFYINDNGDIVLDASNLSSYVKTSDYNGNVISSLINQSSDTVQIKANHINLNGVVTANNYFKINTDGSMVAVNGQFKGKITSTSGMIGGITIKSNSLYADGINEYYQYTNYDGTGSGDLISRKDSFNIKNNGTILLKYDATINGQETSEPSDMSGTTGSTLLAPDYIELKSTRYNNSKTLITSGTIKTESINSLQSVSSPELIASNGAHSTTRLWSEVDNNNARFKINVYSLSMNDSSEFHFILHNNGVLKSFRPATDGGAYLGTSNCRWAALYATSGTVQTSDLKQKDVIDDYDFKVKDFIMGLKPIAYRLTSKGAGGKRIHMGFGAQPVNTLIKKLELGDLSLLEAWKINDNSDLEEPYYGEDIDDKHLRWGMKYEEFIAPIVLMLQQQEQRINKLEKLLERKEN